MPVLPLALSLVVPSMCYTTLSLTPVFNMDGEVMRLIHPV